MSSYPLERVHTKNQIPFGALEEETLRCAIENSSRETGISFAESRKSYNTFRTVCSDIGGLSFVSPSNSYSLVKIISDFDYFEFNCQQACDVARGYF